MSNTSYSKAITSTFDSYSATDSVVVSSDLPSRFYLRGLSVSIGQSSGAAANLLKLTFQDGPGQGNQDGIIRLTGGNVNVWVSTQSIIVPDDSYILIVNGLYFWSNVDSSSSYPTSITVYYT
jgi:hypothetical protein